MPILVVDRRTAAEVIEELRGIRHALVLLNRTVSHLVPTPPPPEDAVASLRLVAQGVPMPVSITNAQSVPYTLTELDAAGNPVSPAVPFDAPPVWISDNAAVATVAAAADGLSAVVTPASPTAVGVATISASGTIKGRTVTGSDPVTVTATVASLGLVAGTPTP